jgi:hypothetical protein
MLLGNAVWRLRQIIQVCIMCTCMKSDAVFRKLHSDASITISRSIPLQYDISVVLNKTFHTSAEISV